MIVKSMSRKAPTFGQLAAYIGRDASPSSGTAFVRNIYADGRDQAEVVGQFLDNYRYLPERKGGNALYHEIVALEPQPHLAPEAVEAALHDLAERYCQQRAPHQLAWGRVHTDSDFPHIHLMISANAVRSDRRVRMDRQAFANVQRDVERWRAEHLPELRARKIYDRHDEKETPKQPIQEGEQVRREQKPSQKQRVFGQLLPLFQMAKDRASLETALGGEGFSLYRRGRSWGVIAQEGGRRYRLRTLGLEPAFNRVPEHVPDREKPEDQRETDLLQQRMAKRAREVLDRFDREDR